MPDNLPCIMIGAGGHASVLLDLLRCLGKKIIGVTSLDLEQGGEFQGIPVLGDDSILGQHSPEEVSLILGIGSLGPNSVRQKIFQQMRARGFHFPALIHPSAIIASDVILGDGTQIMAGSILQTGVHVADNVIINTRVSVDHDTMVGAHSHLAPGVICSGGVRIGEASHLGTGAVVIQGISIGAGSLIAAGAVVTKNVVAGTKVRGVPARSYLS